MDEFTVSYVIETDGLTHVEAAKAALAVLKDPRTFLFTFDVRRFDSLGESRKVTLDMEGNLVSDVPGE